MNNSWPLACLWAAASLLRAGTAEAVVVVTHPYVGITYITRTETTPWPLVMHIAIIDWGAPGIRFKLTPPGGTLDTIRQRTADFLNEQHAALAINGHFFLPYPSADTNANVVGLAASQGVVYSPFEPQPIGTGYVDQSYAILPYGAALNIDAFNRPSIVHCDAAFPDHKHVLEPVQLWNALSGSAQIVTNGFKFIPIYSGPPGGLNALNGWSDDFSWYSYPRARTAIGITEDNQRLVLFTVDEEGRSLGMTLDQVADLLINDYEVYNAINLDGGGSTSMALRDPNTRVGQIVNTSSDSPAGRATGSNLAVFARPIITRPWLVLDRSSTCTNAAVISWSAFAFGWRLQQNSGLDPANWVNVSALPERVGDLQQVTLFPHGASQFYRLAK